MIRAARARILERVEIVESGCWIWIGCVGSSGYGQVRVFGKSVEAHTVAYEAWVGPTADGLELDHLCRVRACVNPEHLEAVTRKVNVLRSEAFSAINSRKTHCDNGHPFDSSNTHLQTTQDGQVYRRCRRCNREAVDRYKARKRGRRGVGALKREPGATSGETR